MNDEELVEGLKRGKPRAQIEFANRYLEKLSEGLLRRFDLEIVEDAVTDVLMRFIQNPGGIDLSKGALDGYVYTAAKNKALDYVRERNKRKEPIDGLQFLYLSSLDEETIGEEGGEDASGDGFSSYGRDVLQACSQIIDTLQLTDEELDHIRLRMVDKLQPKEVAALMGLSDVNERVRWHRLGKKIEREWVKYPVLVEYAEKLRARPLTSVTGTE